MSRDDLITQKLNEIALLAIQPFSDFSSKTKWEMMMALRTTLSQSIACFTDTATLVLMEKLCPPQ